MRKSTWSSWGERHGDADLYLVPPTATEAGEGAAEAAGAGAAPALRGADAAGGGAAARGARAGNGPGTWPPPSTRIPLPLITDFLVNTPFLPLESKLLNC